MEGYFNLYLRYVVFVIRRRLNRSCIRVVYHERPFFISCDVCRIMPTQSRKLFSMESVLITELMIFVYFHDEYLDFWTITYSKSTLDPCIVV